MIEVLNVSKEYSGKRVLSDVSFTARDGKVTGFVGPNGAGKSTLLRIISGVTTASSGAVAINGIGFNSSERPASHLGVFLSAEWIPGNMTGASFLAYVCDTQGLLPKRVAELLDLVGLTGASRRQVKTYSLGMRQRLGIAAAFAGDPQNLILDEPINGLDPDAIQWIRNFLRRAADEGKAVLLSSHHMSELSLVADDVVLLDQGVVARQGQLSSFVASTERNVYIESGTLEDVIRVLGDAGYHAAPYRSGALVREVEPDEVGRVVFGADRGLTHLSLLTRSLEETYFDTISIKEDIQGGTAR